MEADSSLWKKTRDKGLECRGPGGQGEAVGSLEKKWHSMYFAFLNEGIETTFPAPTLASLELQLSHFSTRPSTPPRDLVIKRRRRFLGPTSRDSVQDRLYDLQGPMPNEMLGPLVQNFTTWI